MVKRSYNLPDTEPEQQAFELPSEKEHLFQVTDIFTCNDETGKKLGLDQDTVSAKCEIVGGNEEGRTLLQRCSLDENWKGFFATRLFLKAIGESYKGQALNIDTDRWIGRQFYATVVHNSNNGKTFANIDKYNFEKQIEQGYKPPVGEEKQTINPEDIQWDN